VKVYLPSANMSASPTTTIYRSTDNGNTFETTGTIAQSFPSSFTGAPSSPMVQDLNLPRGVFLVSVLSGGYGTANTFSAAIGTAELVSCYQ
jgi:hypothetical protein